MGTAHKISVLDKILSVCPINLVQLPKGWGIRCYYKSHQTVIINCLEITSFDDKEVTEVVIVRPLSYPIRDVVPTRLRIEVDSLGLILDTVLG